MTGPFLVPTGEKKEKTTVRGQPNNYFFDMAMKGVNGKNKSKSRIEASEELYCAT